MESAAFKIMYLADTYENPYAGTEGQLLMLVDGLDRKKYEPHLTLLRRSEFINKNSFPCPISILDIDSMAKISTVRKIIKFARKLKNDGFKLVHIFFNDSSIIAPIILKLSGLKVIISRRDMGYWYTFSQLLFLKLNGLFIDHVIVNSEAVKNVTMKKEGIPANKISVIYNGYENIDTYSTNEKPDFTRIGIKDSDLVLGLVANIRPLKRIDDVIKAMPNILQAIPNAKFIHVGGGNDRDLRELAKSLGVAESVIFVGQQKSPKVFIRRFDVAILCSESEGFSNSIVEYMKCCTPVVCTDVGGNREIVLDGETGYLIHMGDVNALAEKVIMLFKNPHLMKKLSETGYQMAELKYNKKIMVDKHELMYREIIG